MMRNFWHIVLGVLTIVPVVLAGCVNAGTANRENQAMQFSYTTNGAADGSINTYGNNAISVSGDVLTVEIGDSDGNRNVSGVGIYESRLKGENLVSARKLGELLCSPKDPASDVPIPDLYVAKCGGEIKSSYVRDFSRPVAIKIADLVDSLRNAGVQDGRKIVKLDVSLISIDRSKDGFLVSVRFDNSGDYPINFRTPDKWNPVIGRNMDILGVNGRRIGSKSPDSEIGFGLAGKLLENPGGFPDGKVTLAPRSSVTFKMKTTSVSKFAAGTYELNAGAFMNIEVTGIQSSLVRVDFHSDYKNPTRVTFDRDYPSTPQEREQWEAYQRTRLSYFPVNPGEKFAEDGLYRAVRTTGSGAYRSLQLVPFKAGDVATRDNVKMLMASASGTELNGPVQWVWEGSAPTPVKQWSFDITEGTEHVCKAGTVCPRSGRWLARVHSGSFFTAGSYRYDLAGIVTLRHGQSMPVRNDGADWEWLGI
ncbi:hypothetical protein R69927_07517 [Paraburkholderia domus]|uniref:hypothetical protein n=1 Tax=Paraburkholderia domus TaxID=2793075 RepID=UPI001B2D25B6|nr:hypothetical protein [Paraburkholderia domus]CAE6852888.1 hypothetical protein R75483_07684 [Paraburkholderia domus]CAE6937817.1 hypothetical protein R69927_07517 [Paraburkholderia domus]CAE6968567.1 hypothetical protein R70199_07952 [Paraburkholderia domus]